jgi:RNA polymerase sigma-70 factor (ECF subfamily)
MPAEVELFRKAQAGDRTAFDHLRLRMREPMRRFVRRLIGRSSSEEDILQDAFVALYLHRHRIDPVENFRPFLYRTVRNFCYGELRKNGRIQTVPLEGSSEVDFPVLTLADPRMTPEEWAQWADDYLQIRKEIGRLPELQRQTLILFSGEGLSYAEVALSMATDAATVKSRLHLARKTLLKRLRPEVLESLGLRNETRDWAKTSKET